MDLVAFSVGELEWKDTKCKDINVDQATESVFQIEFKQEENGKSLKPKKISFNLKDLLRDEGGKCVLQIYKSTAEDEDGKNTWYFGSIIFDKYYVVFDATTATQDAHHDFLQLGIAEKDNDRVAKK